MSLHPAATIRTSRVLYVTPVSPFNTGSGAAQRSQLMLKALQLDHVVDVLEVLEGGQLKVARQPTELPGPDTHHVVAHVAPDRNPFRRFQPRPALLPLLETALGRPLTSYALMVGRHLWPISQLPLNIEVRTLVDLDDWRFRVDGAAEWSPAQWMKRMRKGLSHQLARRALKRFQSGFSVCAQDQVELQALVPTTPLPNVHPALKAQGTARASGHRVLFVGAMWYPPNAEAVDWFLKRVWPLVRTHRPDAEFLIAGAGPEPLRQAWASHPGVSAPGFVPDLQATYSEAAVVVAPILSGAGSNVKVLEALMHRRPCVVSRLVAAAFEDHLQPGTHCLVGETAPEFAEHVVRALEDPGALLPMTDAAWHTVQTHYSPQRFVQTVQQQVAQMLAPTST